MKRFVVKSRMDVLDYMITKKKHSLTEAAAVHLMNLDFINRLREKESNDNKVLTPEEIDRFVDNIYSAAHLDTFKAQGAKLVKDYTRDLQQDLYFDRVEKLLAKEKRFLNKYILNKTIWGGVAGNILTFVLGIFFAIAVAGFQSNDIGQSTVSFYQKCFAPLLKPNNTNNN